jgi:hypothetical protein
MSHIRDSIFVKGALKIVLADAQGNIKDEREVPNLVVNVGKEFIASRMIGTSDNIMSHMAIGTGTTSPVGGDTTLQTEAGRVTLASNVRTANAIAYVATFPAGTGTGAITEAGILNDSTGGILLCRTTFAEINKGAADTLGITWTVTVA